MGAIRRVRGVSWRQQSTGRVIAAGRGVRRNGGMELILQPGRVMDAQTGRSAPGYPYGVVPRLVVIWMTTEVLRTERQELNLGASLGGFLAEMKLTRGGTQAVRVRDQLTRLFTSSLLVTATDNVPGASMWGHDFFRFAARSRLWWSDLQPDDPTWASTVTVSDEFFRAILAESVPLPEIGLTQLRTSTSSPLALDIYTWLAHRLHKVDGCTPPIKWSDLAVQFGGDYTRARTN